MASLAPSCASASYGGTAHDEFAAVEDLEKLGTASMAPRPASASAAALRTQGHEGVMFVGDNTRRGSRFVIEIRA